MLLWTYVRRGEVSFGRSLNSALSSLHRKQSCSLRGDWEPEELPKICGEEEGEITKKQAEDCLRSAGLNEFILFIWYTEGVFCESHPAKLAFQSCGGVTAFYYTRRFDGKIGGKKCNIEKFHPQYTWNGGKPNWGCQKVFKESYQKKKTKQSNLSYLSQSSMENNEYGIQAPFFCWGDA